LVPTARAVWDRLIDLDHAVAVVTDNTAEGSNAVDAYDQARREAESAGQSIFAELIQTHEKRQTQERQKRRRAIDARRKAIERIGLPQVRAHRMRELEREDSEWKERLARQDSALPELSALLMLRIAPSRTDG
jgi:hypothetical protein